MVYNSSNLAKYIREQLTGDLYTNNECIYPIDPWGTLDVSFYFNGVYTRLIDGADGRTDMTVYYLTGHCNEYGDAVYSHWANVNKMTTAERREFLRPLFENKLKWTYLDWGGWLERWALTI